MGESAPIVLVILDGFGWAPRSKGNAIASARTPHFAGLQTSFPSTLLAASGVAVGLPANQVGNSEAGHLNIGGGRVVLQDAVRISRAIDDGTFFKNPALNEAIVHAEQARSKLHIMGLVSAHQSAHANPDHLLALLTLVRKRNVPRVFLHLFTDGRDANPRHGLLLIRQISRGLPPNVKIASIIGRHYAMERKKVWKYTERAYDCLTRGKGEVAPDAVSAVRAAYDRGETDEFVLPTVLARYERTGRIGHRDAVIFFNLRSDRARQLSKAFVQPQFNARNPGSFRRKVVLRQLKFIAMTDFGPDLGPVLTAFPSEDVKNSLPVALTGFSQLYVAETEKYAHMTYFFNGGYDHPVAGEERIAVPSPDVSHYDVAPAMSAASVTREVVRAIDRGIEFVSANYANADMLGHTGNFLATVQGIEVIDQHLGVIADLVLGRQGTLVVTGDHGNAEQMLQPNGDVNTEHTNSPVPLVIAQGALVRRPHELRSGGRLGDLAPTLLELLGHPKPAVMTGTSLWR
ncbi:MAG: 2,3-bisphosphoglycerate-independent phosphoglycerate mutase [Candidatus Kerfeldbacteria bacterium]|nr:2,3-bisphosphoglycerate-independent phosphoglycerate mutase [Candidatus Kerfeldbacteria bacterium]